MRTPNGTGLRDRHRGQHTRRNQSNRRVHRTWTVGMLAAMALVAAPFGLAACAQREAPTELRENARLAVAPALGHGSSALATQVPNDASFSPAGTLPLPVNQSFSGPQNQTALGIKSTGLGAAGSFRIDNPSNIVTALQAKTNGSGAALMASSLGGGPAAWIQIFNSASTARALMVTVTRQRRRCVQTIPVPAPRLSCSY